MMTLRTYFDGNGELIAVYILPRGNYGYATPEVVGSVQAIETECPDMRTALTVAAAWERTGRKI